MELQPNDELARFGIINIRIVQPVNLAPSGSNAMGTNRFPNLFVPWWCSPSSPSLETRESSGAKEFSRQSSPYAYACHSCYSQCARLCQQRCPLFSIAPSQHPDTMCLPTQVTLRTCEPRQMPGWGMFRSRQSLAGRNSIESFSRSMAVLLACRFLISLSWAGIVRTLKYVVVGGVYVHALAEEDTVDAGDAGDNHGDRPRSTQWDQDGTPLKILWRNRHRSFKLMVWICNVLHLC